MEGITDVGPTNLNHLETGLQASAAIADAAIPAPIGPATSAGLVWNGSSWVAAKIVNANVDAAAAIAYSKLTLAGSIVNNDISVSAAIAQSKLANGPGFEIGYTQFTSPVTVSSSNEASPTAVVSAGSLTFDGTTVLIEFFAIRVDVVAGGDCLFNLWGDGADLGRIGQTGGSATTDFSSVHCARRLTPSAASHTYQIQARQSGGNATVQVGPGGVANFLPGFIRITKV